MKKNNTSNNIYFHPSCNNIESFKLPNEPNEDKKLPDTTNYNVISTYLNFQEAQLITILVHYISRNIFNTAFNKIYINIEYLKEIHQFFRIYNSIKKFNNVFEYVKKLILKY